MKVRIYYMGDETIVVGLDKDNNPFDSDGTLFGTDSGRLIEDYDYKDIDIEKGEVAIILSRPKIEVV